MEDAKILICDPVTKNDIEFFDHPTGSLIVDYSVIYTAVQGIEFINVGTSLSKACVDLDLNFIDMLKHFSENKMWHDQLGDEAVAIIKIS